MNRGNTIDVLNRLVAVHNCSLPMYLDSARPWTSRGDERTQTTLAHMVADQKRVVEQLGRMIVDAGGSVDMGQYPMRYTDTHDLALDFLLVKLIEHQQAVVRTMEECVTALRGDPPAQAVAAEALGAAKGHLESLQELLPDASGGTADVSDRHPRASG
jgi:hypothetical protein